MRVLVTGGSGQIGGAVAQALLERGDEVRCLVRDPERTGNLAGLAVECVVGDVTLPDSLPAAVEGMDAVVHAAGVVSFWTPRQALQQQVNLEGTRHMLDAAVAAGVRRFLLTSSVASLGWVDGDGEGDETTSFNWEGMGLTYMETKRAAQALVLAESRLEPVAVLPGVVFGRGDLQHNGLRVLRQVYDGVLKGAPSGCTTASNLSDVVAGHLAALDTPHHGRAWVLGGWTGSFIELFGEAAAAVDRPAPTWAIPEGIVWAVSLGHEARAWVTGREPLVTRALSQVTGRNRKYSSARAEAELGYRPQPLQVGMAAALQWVRERGDWA